MTERHPDVFKVLIANELVTARVASGQALRRRDMVAKRNAATRVPQAPTTISRRKLSACSSPIAFSKSGPPDRCHSVSRDDVTSRDGVA